MNCIAQPKFTGSEINADIIKLDQYRDELIYVRLVNMLGAWESQARSSNEDTPQLASEWIRNKKAGIYLLDIRWVKHSQQIKLLRN